MEFELKILFELRYCLFRFETFLLFILHVCTHICMYIEFSDHWANTHPIMKLKNQTPSQSNQFSNLFPQSWYKPRFDERNKLHVIYVKSVISNSCFSNDLIFFSSSFPSLLSVMFLDKSSNWDYQTYSKASAQKQIISTASNTPLQPSRKNTHPSCLFHLNFSVICFPAFVFPLGR